MNVLNSFFFLLIFYTCFELIHSLSFFFLILLHSTTHHLIGVLPAVLLILPLPFRTLSHLPLVIASSPFFSMFPQSLQLLPSSSGSGWSDLFLSTMHLLIFHVLLLCNSVHFVFLFIFQFLVFVLSWIPRRIASYMSPNAKPSSADEEDLLAIENDDGRQTRLKRHHRPPPVHLFPVYHPLHGGSPYRPRLSPPAPPHLTNCSSHCQCRSKPVLLL